jgi:hypothetical protein
MPYRPFDLRGVVGAYEWDPPGEAVQRDPACSTADVGVVASYRLGIRRLHCREQTFAIARLRARAAGGHRICPQREAAVKDILVEHGSAQPLGAGA